MGLILIILLAVSLILASAATMVGLFPPSWESACESYFGDPKLTSKVVGVKVLAAAAATIFPTLPDPVNRTKCQINQTHQNVECSLL
jgi:hypothetical protein